MENIIFKFIENNFRLKNRPILLLTKFGSHLYGTSTPESDVDYKGVFIPNKKEIYTQMFPQSIRFSTSDSDSKNNKNDVDIEVYSIYKFFKLAIKGETVALDLLHVTKDIADIWDIHWNIIYRNKVLFYCQDLKAFLDYCKKQAAKYGIKGSRIEACEALLKVMNTVSEDERMNSIWNKLPLNKHCTYRYDLDTENIKYYDCCGKVIQNTAKVGYAKRIYQGYLNKYGKRARLARQNKNIDWKAISHALRAGYELLHLYRSKNFRFPLKEADFLRDVKLGKYDFSYVQNVLEDLIEEVEFESKISGLPKSIEINIDKITNLLFTVVKSVVGN